MLLITFIALVSIALYYIYYGYTNRIAKDYVAPAALTTAKVAISTSVGLSRDIRRLHIENENENSEQQDLADLISINSRAAEMDISVSKVFDHRAYRHNALERLNNAKLEQASRKAAKKA